MDTYPKNQDYIDVLVCMKNNPKFIEIKHLFLGSSSRLNVLVVYIDFIELIFSPSNQILRKNFMGESNLSNIQFIYSFQMLSLQT